MTFLKLTERIENKLLLPSQELITGTTQWFDQDTEDLYKKNLKCQPNDWYYRNKKIEYNLNSAGYRTKEFTQINWSKSIVVFGCSFVFGVGNAEEDTITGQIESITGIPTINLGSAGASSTFTVHNSVLLNESYPIPKAVVSIWPSPFRCPYYTEDRVMQCGNWNYDRFKIGYYWNVDRNHALMNLRLNAMTLRQLWQSKTSYYELSMFSTTANYLECDFIKQVDDARDVRKQDGAVTAHPGKITNKLVAEKIIESLWLQNQ